jgi:hypothetical protein
MFATSRFGQGAFFAGVAFIASATILNVAHDNAIGFELESLPFFIGDLYATTGKVGVTLLLLSMGMVCLMVALWCWGRRGRARERAVKEQPGVCFMELESGKYLAAAQAKRAAAMEEQAG